MRGRVRACTAPASPPEWRERVTSQGSNMKAQQLDFYSEHSAALLSIF